MCYLYGIIDVTVFFATNWPPSYCLEPNLPKIKMHCSPLPRINSWGSHLSLQQYGLKADWVWVELRDQQRDLLPKSQTESYSQGQHTYMETREGQGTLDPNCLWGSFLADTESWFGHLCLRDPFCACACTPVSLRSKQEAGRPDLLSKLLALQAPEISTQVGSCNPDQK